jgi:hypothetical protein
VITFPQRLAGSVTPSCPAISALACPSRCRRHLLGHPMRHGRASPRAGVVYGETCRRPLGCAFDMTKKYELVLDRISLPGGGFVEAFRMALLDLSCFGEGRRLDLTGYPHESESAALQSDWAALGVDLKRAAQRVLAEAEGSNAGGGSSADARPIEPTHTEERRELSVWQGPLPPPAVLQGYKDLLPDGPDRVFKQWERERPSTAKAWRGGANHFHFGTGRLLAAPLSCSRSAVWRSSPMWLRLAQSGLPLRLVAP